MILEEVAEYPRLSVQTVHKMAQKGKIQALKDDKHSRSEKREC